MSTGIADQRTAVDHGREAIVTHLQSIMRAASVRPAELGVQWCEKARGARWLLRLRWGDESFDLLFDRPDVEEWSRTLNFSPKYRAEIYGLIDWLVAIG